MGKTDTRVEGTRPSTVTKLPFTGEAGEAENARSLLRHWVRAPTMPQRVVQRSRIVLLFLDGLRTPEIAARLGVSMHTVELWTRRFASSGPDALLHDAPGRGRHATMTASVMRERLRQANLLRADDKPLSLRRAAEFLGISATSVWRALDRPSLPKGRPPSTPPSNAS